MILTNSKLGHILPLNFCKLCNINKYFKNCSRSTHTTGPYKTHYEILNLKKECTDKEIRNAFIQLSKEHHPDVNKNSGAHSHYTKIVEAYNILGKPETRRLYDLQIGSSFNSGPHRVYFYRDDFFRDPTKDPSFWEYRDKSKDEEYRSKPYYGIRGMRRLSNSIIALACLFFAGVGVGLQVLLISRSLTLKRENILRRTSEAEKILADLKHQAEVNGNEKQTELLKEKFKQNQYTRYFSEDIK